VDYNEESKETQRENLYDLIYSQNKNVNIRRGYQEGIYPIKPIKEEIVSQIHSKSIF
jgi:hypothetical protein